MVSCFKRVDRAVKKTVSATKSWIKPSVVMFLACPTRRKSVSVKTPAAKAPKVEAPKSLTIKNERGITIADKKAEVDLRATYSIFGKVKLSS